MAAFVFMGYPLYVLQSLCLFDPVLYVLSNEVLNFLVSMCSSIYLVYRLAMK